MFVLARFSSVCVNKRIVWFEWTPVTGFSGLGVEGVAVPARREGALFPFLFGLPVNPLANEPVVASGVEVEVCQRGGDRTSLEFLQVMTVKHGSLCS